MTFCWKKKTSSRTMRSPRRRGAGDRTRTGTLSPAVDFESTTSTNSITPAGAELIIHDFSGNGKWENAEVRGRMSGKK